MSRLAGVFLLFIGLFFLLLPAWIDYEFSYDEPIIEYTNCYDRSGNEIIGLVCEDELTMSENVYMWYLVSLIGMFMGFALIISSVLIIAEEV